MTTATAISWHQRFWFWAQHGRALAAAEPAFRLPLALGSRPCSADMKPLIGAAPRHPGLWIYCGHGHQGFTLGPASARLLADLIEGGTPYTEAAAFAPLRFGR